MFLFSILHGKSFGLESVKTWNSPGFTKYSDWCFNTVWNSSDSLKVCVLFVSQWCSCDADASHDTRSFLSHKMILAQQLEVHLVLKVEPHKKKVSGLSWLHLDVAICVWKRGKGVFLGCTEKKSFFYGENLAGWKEKFAFHCRFISAKSVTGEFNLAVLIWR